MNTSRISYRVVGVVLLTYFLCLLTFLAMANGDGHPLTPIVAKPTLPQRVLPDFAPLPARSPKVTPTTLFDYDPIRFTVRADKDSVTIGEELTLTITADLLPISSSMLFFFEEQRGFSLKMLLPKGFQQTGGTYQDGISDKLTADSKTHAEYTIRGHFTELESDAHFSLLRGPKDPMPNSLYIKKGEVAVYPKHLTTGAAREAATCDVASKVKGISYSKTGNTYQLQVILQSGVTNVAYSLDNITFKTTGALSTTATQGYVYIRYTDNTGCKIKIPYNLTPSRTTNKATTGTCDVGAFDIKLSSICRQPGVYTSVFFDFINGGNCNQIEVLYRTSAVSPWISFYTIPTPSETVIGNIINPASPDQPVYDIKARCSCQNGILQESNPIVVSSYSITQVPSNRPNLYQVPNYICAGGELQIANGCSLADNYLFVDNNNFVLANNPSGTFRAPNSYSGITPFAVYCYNECGQSPELPDAVTGTTTILNPKITVTSGAQILTTITAVNNDASVALCAGSSLTLVGSSSFCNALYFFTNDFGGLSFPNNIQGPTAFASPLTPQTYKLNCVTNSGSCERQITLVPQPRPAAPIISGPSNLTVANNMVVSLTATTAGCAATSLYWFNGSNTSLATGYILPVTVTKTESYYAKCVQLPCDSYNSDLITIVRSDQVANNGRIIGYLDGPTCGSALGWVADRDALDKPLEVNIIITNAQGQVQYEQKMVPNVWRDDMFKDGPPSSLPNDDPRAHVVPYGISWVIPDQYLSGYTIGIKVVSTAICSP